MCSPAYIVMGFHFYVIERYYPVILHGFAVTLLYTVISLLLCISWGILVGALRSQKLPVINEFLKGYTAFFRETPLLVQLFFIFYGLPHIGIFMSPSVSGVLAIVLNDGAFVAEIVRGGIQGVPQGQTEAAKSLAMSRVQTLRYIVLPQGIRSVLPALLGQGSYILKDTALLSLITIEELTGAADYINDLLFEPGTAYGSAAVLYIITFWLITILTSKLRVGRLSQKG